MSSSLMGARGALEVCWLVALAAALVLFALLLLLWLLFWRSVVEEVSGVLGRLCSASLRQCCLPVGAVLAASWGRKRRAQAAQAVGGPRLPVGAAVLRAPAAFLAPGPPAAFLALGSRAQEGR